MKCGPIKLAIVSDKKSEKKEALFKSNDSEKPAKRANSVSLHKNMLAAKKAFDTHIESLKKSSANFLTDSTRGKVLVISGTT